MIIITVILFLSSLPNIIFLLVSVLLIISARFCQTPSWTPNAKPNAPCLRGVLFHFRCLTRSWISKKISPTYSKTKFKSVNLIPDLVLCIKGKVASLSDKRRFSKLLEVIESRKYFLHNLKPSWNLLTSFRTQFYVIKVK